MRSRTTLKQLVQLLAERQITPMLWGKHGVGKTALVRELAAETGRTLRILYLATQEPGDLIGIPYQRNGRTEWAPPTWWPEEGEKTILFLDEFNRAPRFVLSAILPLLTERQLHGRRLADDVWIIAASNPPSVDYEVTGFDHALAGRFVHLIVSESWEEWRSWIRQQVDLPFKKLFDSFDLPKQEEEKDLLQNPSLAGKITEDTLKQLQITRTTNPRSLTWALQMIAAPQFKELSAAAQIEALVGLLPYDDGVALWRALLDTQTHVAHDSINTWLACFLSPSSNYTARRQAWLAIPILMRGQALLDVLVQEVKDRIEKAPVPFPKDNYDTFYRQIVGRLFEIWKIASHGGIDKEVLEGTLVGLTQLFKKHFELRELRRAVESFSFPPEKEFNTLVGNVFNQAF